MRDIGSVFFFVTGGRGTGFTGEVSGLDVKEVGVEVLLIRSCAKPLGLDD